MPTVAPAVPAPVAPVVAPVPAPFNVPAFDATAVARAIVDEQERRSAARLVKPGAHKAMPRVMRYLAEDHVMMVGPAGTGKTTLAHQCADALGIPFGSMSFTEDTLRSELLGFVDAGGTYHETAFYRCFARGGLFLGDEMDRGRANAVGLMNQALANGHMEFPIGPVNVHPDFRCMAAANTYGLGADGMYVGANRLDAASIDRFAFLTVDIDEDVETAMCRSTGLPDEEVTRVLTYVRRLRRNASARKLEVIVSPRASHGMCKVMTRGESFDDAADARLFKGMTAQDRATLCA